MLHISLTRHILLPATVLAALLLGACGSTDTSVTPTVPDNPFLEAKAGTDSTLEIMTWNVENFPLDGTITVNLVAKAVAGVGPDIVALEEVVSDTSFASVVSELDGWQGYRASSAYASQNLAFLYRDDGHLTNVSFHEIFTHDSREFPRAPLVMSAEWNGQPFVVVANHLKCCGDSFIDETDPYDETTRRRDACLLLQAYADTTWADRPVVMVGDWNDELDDPTDGNVFANFLAVPDQWRFADLAIALDPAAAKSYPKYGSHLDHILVSSPWFTAMEAPEALTEVVLLDQYLTGGLASYYGSLSDHRPVLLRLRP